MEINKNQKFFHGIMFHHFHDEKIHTKGQGSISKDVFLKIIKNIGKENILDANVFYEKFNNKNLKENEVCLTFDDAIKSQIDIALPVIEDLNIKCFFFVQSNVFDGDVDYLEVFRYFRMNFFLKVNDFYKLFYDFLDQNVDTFFKDHRNWINAKLLKSPYYSIDDVKFRLIRDLYLNKDQYENIMFKIMKEKKFDYNQHYLKLIFDKSDLLKLDKLGHLIGLHSHNHPTLIEKLSYDNQKQEYEKCLKILSNILKNSKNKIKYMSHPCGSYNQDTLDILKKLGIDMGFVHTTSIDKSKGMTKINNSSLEISRKNHTSFIKNL
ncbi:MAG: xylanase [Candidatus Pelagibacter sp.]|nr:xylanase [Candidatus Pelagibacter sp.]|tara:strand:+ start:180 stop:1145 length:966 start_codon:yes stop_codon:yes gene_type:complete